MSEVNGSNECIDHGVMSDKCLNGHHGGCERKPRCSMALPDQQIPAAMRSAEAGD